MMVGQAVEQNVAPPSFAGGDFGGFTVSVPDVSSNAQATDADGFGTDGSASAAVASEASAATEPQQKFSSCFAYLVRDEYGDIVVDRDDRPDLKGNRIDVSGHQAGLRTGGSLQIFKVTPRADFTPAFVSPRVDAARGSARPRPDSSCSSPSGPRRRPHWPARPSPCATCTT
jgi:hypothetical protein